MIPALRSATCRSRAWLVAGTALLLAASPAPAAEDALPPATTVPAAAAPAPPAAPAPVKPEKKPDATGGLLPNPDSVQEVEITADTMDMDFAKRLSTFSGNVVVREARMRLQADKMTVHFGENQKAERIECVGNVVIEQPEAGRTARAGRAEYDIVKGTIMLTENPSLKMGDSTLSNAARITYYRDDERVICDSAPNAERPVIRLSPKSGAELPPLFNNPAPDPDGN